MVLLLTPLNVISTLAYIWTRQLILKNFFTKLTRRQQEEWSSYGASVPALILLVPNEFTNRWLCQYLRIAAKIVLDGQSPATADPHYGQTKPRNHYPKMQSEELWSSIFNNWKLFAKETCCFVFDCLNRTISFSFRNHFQRFHHNSLNTKNNRKAAKLPKVKLDFARRSFFLIF